MIEGVAGAIYADGLDHIEVAHDVMMRGDVVFAVLAGGSREPFRIGCIRP